MKFIEGEVARPMGVSARWRRLDWLVATAAIPMVTMALAKNWIWFTPAGGVSMVLAVLLGALVLVFALRAAILSRPSATPSRETLDASIPSTNAVGRER